jgi:hypothetical protein
MLVTRYHGVWSIVLAFNEAPVITDWRSRRGGSHGGESEASVEGDELTEGRTR